MKELLEHFFYALSAAGIIACITFTIGISIRDLI